MSQPLQLYRLQQVDSKLDKVRARLKEIEIALNDDAAVASARKKLETAEEAHHRAERELKRAEEEVQVQQGKIENNQKTLYGGTVKNPKELEDLQNESGALNRFLDTLEERQLEKMIAFEETETAFNAAQKNLDQVKKDAGQEELELSAEQKRLLEEVESYETERETIVGGIDAEDLALYTKLRETRAGVAVAQVKDSSCGACGATLTASQGQVARSPNKITTCETCGRVLYSN